MRAKTRALLVQIPDTHHHDAWDVLDATGMKCLARFRSCVRLPHIQGGEVSLLELRCPTAAYRRRFTRLVAMLRAKAGARHVSPLN